MSAPVQSVAHAADLIHRGRVADAEALLRRLVAKRPLDPYAASWLGYALRLLGRSDHAVYFAHLAHQHLPDDPAILAGYGAALQSAGKFEDALKALISRPLTIDDPQHLPLIECLAQVYSSLMIGGECVALLDRTMAAHQDHSRLAPLRAHALLISGRADEAFEEWMRILHRSDSVPGALEATISASLYCSRVDPDTRVSLLNRLGRQVRAHMGPAHTQWNLTRDPARPLHVGLVSADFRNHVMAYFIEPLLQAFSRDEWRVTLYSTSKTIDRVTERLRAYPGVSYTSLV